MTLVVIAAALDLIGGGPLVSALPYAIGGLIGLGVATFNNRGAPVGDAFLFDEWDVGRHSQSSGHEG